VRTIAAELTERDDGLLALAGAPEPAALPAPRLLGQFDPVLLGWRSREDIVGSHRGIVTTNGLFRPIALVEGRAAGIWRLRAGRVELAPFATLSASVADALAADADELERYLASDAPAAA